MAPSLRRPWLRGVRTLRRSLICLGIVLLAACSSSHKKSDSTDTSTTTTPASTSTGASTSVPSIGPATTPTTSSPPTTSGGGTNSSVRLDMSYVGSSPVECNAPTQIELKWTASGAKDIALSIDGKSPIAHYPNGMRDEFIPLACDNKSHTYTLTATAPGVNVTRSITVQTKSTA